LWPKSASEVLGTGYAARRIPARRDGPEAGAHNDGGVRRCENAIGQDQSGAISVVKSFGAGPCAGIKPRFEHLLTPLKTLPRPHIDEWGAGPFNSGGYPIQLPLIRLGAPTFERGEMSGWVMPLQSVAAAHKCHSVTSSSVTQDAAAPDGPARPSTINPMHSRGGRTAPLGPKRPVLLKHRSAPDAGRPDRPAASCPTAWQTRRQPRHPVRASYPHPPPVFDNDDPADTASTTADPGHRRHPLMITGTGCPRFSLWSILPRGRKDHHAVEHHALPVLQTESTALRRGSEHPGPHPFGRRNTAAQFASRAGPLMRVQRDTSASAPQATRESDQKTSYLSVIGLHYS